MDPTTKPGTIEILEPRRMLAGDIDLAIAVEQAPQTVVPSQPAAYEILVTNHGPDTADGVRVTANAGRALKNMAWTASEPMKKKTDVLNLSDLNGLNGFRIINPKSSDSLLTHGIAAGDVNGDGFDDLIVNSNWVSRRESHVVFGGPADRSQLDLSTLDGTTGFHIPDSHGQAAPDLNQDGIDDLYVDGFSILGGQRQFPAVIRPGLDGASNEYILSGDFTGDFLITADDVRFLLTNVLATTFGDADLDGEVDFDDFLLLSASFGLAGGWADGDFNGDGRIDFYDFLVLSRHFF